MIENLPKDKAIFLFDGTCNLCAGTVNFILKRDKKNQFLFAPLQSQAGQRLLRELDLNEENFDTFVLIENEIAYTRSAGALRYLKRLGGLWGWLYVFILIPRPIRDFFYNVIARNRHRWFGKREECLRPTPEIKSKFLE